jgi:hypothetical protein
MKKKKKKEEEEFVFVCRCNKPTLKVLNDIVGHDLFSNWVFEPIQLGFKEESRTHYLLQCFE